MYKIVFVYITLLFMLINIASSVETEKSLDGQAEIDKPVENNETQSAETQVKTEENGAEGDNTKNITQTVPEKATPATVNNGATKKTATKTKTKAQHASKKSTKTKNTTKKHANYAKKFHLENYIMRVTANGKTACSGFAVGKKVVLAPYSCFSFIKKNGYKIGIDNQKKQKFQNVSFVNVAANKKFKLASQWILLITDKEVMQESFLKSYTKPIDQTFIQENEIFMTGIANVKNNVNLKNAYGCELHPSSLYVKGRKLNSAIFVKCNGARDKNMYIGAALLGVNKRTQDVELLGIKLDTKKEEQTNSFYSIILPTYAINAIKEHIQKEEQKHKIVEL